jgi:hypothetical protein
MQVSVFVSPPTQVLYLKVLIELVAAQKPSITRYDDDITSSRLRH